MEEEYPTIQWTEELTIDFFTNRFGGGARPWVKDNLYTLLKTGVHRNKWVRFWAAVRQRAAELLGADSPQPGIDYSMSEIVHCKSTSEIGVRSAMGECMDRYLDPMLETSGAKVIVGLGGLAGEALRSRYDVSKESSLAGPLQIGDRSRYLTFLPHPNHRGKRTFLDHLSPDELAVLTSALAD